MQSKKMALITLVMSLLLIIILPSKTARAATISSLDNSQGIMLDLGRHPMDEDGVKSIIKAASDQGMSYVDLHLSDNENLSYQSEYLENNPSSTVLSTQTLKNLVAYAKEQNIELIPDVDMPSHAGAILKQLKISHPDVYNSIKMDNETIDYTKSDSLIFVETIYKELDNVFSDQLHSNFMIGADEVPGSNDSYITLIDFINQINKFQNNQGFNTTIWNDSILKSELSRLDNNITINYWSQSGNNSDPLVIADRYANRISIPDILSSGHSVVNCNSYATYYQIKYIGNENDDNYFINYLNNIYKPNIFNEIDSNGNNQNWTLEDGVTTNGTMVSLWGENSSEVTSEDIANFVRKMNIPQQV